MDRWRFGTVLIAIFLLFGCGKLFMINERESRQGKLRGFWETPAYTPIPGKLRSRAERPERASPRAPVVAHGDDAETITLLCAGACGAGKSNLLSAIFASPYDPTNRKFGRTREISESVVPINAEGRPINLILIDTPGFDLRPGQRESAFDAVQEYLDERFKRTWTLDKKRGRRQMRKKGAGVDAILYTFRPNRIDPEDLEYLQVLQRYGAIVPVISKADSLTSSDLAQFRQRLSSALASAGIETFCTPLATVAPQFQIQPGAEGERSKSSIGVSNSQLTVLRSLLLNDLQRLRQIAWWRYEDFARKKLCKQYAKADRVRKVVVNCLRAGIAGFLLFRWRMRNFNSPSDSTPRLEPSRHAMKLRKTYDSNPYQSLEPTPVRPPPQQEQLRLNPNPPPLNLAPVATGAAAVAPTEQKFPGFFKNMIFSPKPSEEEPQMKTVSEVPKSEAKKGKENVENEDDETKDKRWIYIFPIGFGIFLGPKIANDATWFFRGIFNDIPPS